MEVMAYPAPFKKDWSVQVEFLDGTEISGMSDADVVERWRRVAAWTDPTALDDPAGWVVKVLDRARVFYGADLDGLGGLTPPATLLDRLAASGVLILRRR